MLSGLRPISHYHGVGGMIANLRAVTLSTQGRRGLNSGGSGNYVTIPSQGFEGCFRGWRGVISRGLGGGKARCGVVLGVFGVTKLSQKAICLPWRG
jgi:hypothetical protein